MVMKIHEDIVYIDGDLSLGGYNGFYGYWYPSALATITAFAGGGLANATALTDAFNVIATCASDNDSVKLHSAPVNPSTGIAGPVTFVLNNTTNIVAVYPGDATHTIDGGSAGGMVPIYAYGWRGFVPTSGTAWMSFGTEKNKTGNVAVTAFAGGGRANATELSLEYNLVTTCASDNDSVKLPSTPSTTGDTFTPIIFVHNETNQVCDVFPGDAGDQIDSNGAGNAHVLGPQQTHAFVPTSASQWYSLFDSDSSWTTITNGITAFGGGGLANATQLVAHYNVVSTVAAPNDSVKLWDHPTYTSAHNSGGPVQIVHNASVRNLDIYPGVAGHQIDALGAGNPYTLGGNSTRTFLPTSASQWTSIR